MATAFQSYIFLCWCLALFDAPAKAQIACSHDSHLMGLYSNGLVSPMGVRFPQFKLVHSLVKVVKVIYCTDSGGGLVGGPHVSAWCF